MRNRTLSVLLAMILLLGLSATPLPVLSAQAEAAGSATGQQIVDKAKEYLGKVPYVYGGKTIDGSNPGADCSGFICRIYEKFGFDLWSHRTQLRKCGTNLGTDLSQAQLGDIIWFDGHVAIYAGTKDGNHMIVHETGGSFQNVVYTKVSVVKAELKGIIRIPGVTNNGSSAAVTKYYGKVHDTDGSLAVNDSPKSRANGATMLTSIPEGGTCIVYTDKTSGKWYWVEYNGVQGYAHSNYITLGDPVKEGVYLDLNGFLDGSVSGNLGDYGTADVSVNGQTAKSGCTDYYVQWPEGTSYQVSNIRANSGYAFTGIYKGTASGTVGSSKTDVILSFRSDVSAVTVADGLYTIVSAVDDNKVMDVQGGSKDSGANVQLYQSNQSSAQQFQITKSGDYYTILNQGSGMALDVYGAYIDNGTNIQQYNPNGTSAQKWRFLDAGGGYVFIQSALGPVADVYGGNSDNSTNIQAYYLNQTTAQKWKLVSLQAEPDPEPEAEPTHTHTLSSVPAREPTCIEIGQKAYWKCDECGLIFSDAEGEQETSVSALKIPSLGHDYEDGICIRCGAKDPSYTEPEPDLDNPFVDVPDSAYYCGPVLWAYYAEPQITDGIDDTHFGPSQTVTRGQAVTFLWRSMGKPAPKSSYCPFTDVKAYDYFYQPVLWAVENGITDGTSDTTFSPSATLTRGHIITFLWRTAGRPDATGTGQWYDDAVNWARTNALLGGTAEAFAPDRGCPRSDVVTYLYRVDQKGFLNP